MTDLTIKWPMFTAGVLNNPFNKNCVEAVHIHGYNSEWRGTIEFKNSRTEGTQRFHGHETLEDIAYQMKIFIESLED